MKNGDESNENERNKMYQWIDDSRIDIPLKELTCHFNEKIVTFVEELLQLLNELIMINESEEEML